MGVGKLLEGIEQHHKQQRGQQFGIIGSDQGQQLLRLAETGEIQVAKAHDKRQQQGHQSIRQQGMFQHASNRRLFPLACQTTDDGGQSVGETCRKNNG